MNRTAALLPLPLSTSSLADRTPGNFQACVSACTDAGCAEGNKANFVKDWKTNHK